MADIYLDNLLKREELYENICEPYWDKIEYIINSLITLGTEEGWMLLKKFLLKEEIEPYFLFYNDLYDLKTATEIYEIDKDFFVGCCTIKQIIEKINYNRFMLLRLENGIAVEDKWINEIATNKKMLLVLDNLIDKNCFDKIFARKKLNKMVK